MNSLIENTNTKIAEQLGAKPEWLYALIKNESGWNPNAYNKSGAVGLIQFMPKTLKDLGLLSPTLAALIPSVGIVPEEVKQKVKEEFLMKFPDEISQLLGPVYKYLKRYAPFPTEQSLYMAVFYPAYRSVPVTTKFSDLVRSQNPGIDTVADYIAMVKKKVRRLS